MIANCREYDVIIMGIWQMIQTYCYDDNIINMEILIKLMCKDEHLFWHVYNSIMEDPEHYDYDCFNLYFIMEVFAQNECFLACLCKRISKWVKWHTRLRLLKDKHELSYGSLSAKLIEFCQIKTHDTAEEWYYLDINNEEQGPFDSRVMEEWYDKYNNLIQDSLLIRKKNTSYMSLSKYFKLGIAAFLPVIPQRYRNDNEWGFSVNTNLLQSSKQGKFVKYHMGGDQEDKENFIPLISWGAAYEHIKNKNRVYATERWTWMKGLNLAAINVNDIFYSRCFGHSNKALPRRSSEDQQESTSDQYDEESIVEEEEESSSSAEYEDP